MKTHFKAPWDMTLKATSAAVTLLCIGISVSGFYLPGFRIVGFGFWLHTLLPLAILAGALPFVVRGYTITEGTLRVHRLWWDTQIPLTGLQSAKVIPDAMRGSIRTCGNGGAYSFTGRYWNRPLGHYRAFINDANCPVVLRWPHKTIVLSCDDPEAFVSAVTPP